MMTKYDYMTKKPTEDNFMARVSKHLQIQIILSHK